MKSIKQIETEQMAIAEEIFNMKKIIEIKHQQLALLEEEKKYYSGFSYKAPIDEDEEELSLLELLKVDLVNITYKKKNGDIVEREITLMEEVISDYVNEDDVCDYEDKKSKAKDGYFYAFDCSKKIFKLFILDNVIEYEAI